MPTWTEEGKWDCKSCGRTGNLGRLKNCSACGNAREDDEEIYFDRPPAYKNRVTDAELLEQFNAGPDWTCDHCSGKQRNDHGECQNCGGPKTQAAKRKKPRNAKPQRTAQHTISEDLEDQLIIRSMGYKGKPSGTRRMLTFGAIALCVVSLLFVLFRTTEKDLKVQSVQWSRNVVVERYQVIGEEGFDEDMPSDSFDVVSKGERHHHYHEYQCGTKQESYTDREACGETCSTTPVSCTNNSNGSRTCSGGDRVCSTKYCSVTKYRTVSKMCQESIKKPYSNWSVWRWHKQRDVPLHGFTVDSVRWPSDKELGLGVDCTGGQRERTGSRSEDYTVVFVDEDGGTYKYGPESAKEFQTLPVGSVHHVNYSIALGVELPHE